MRSGDRSGKGTMVGASGHRILADPDRFLEEDDGWDYCSLELKRILEVLVKSAWSEVCST